MTPRGIRNNNPGNIRHGPSRWLGLCEQQQDKDFCTFESPVWGLRALAVLLKGYKRRYGIVTITAAIARWAPANENDTQSYVKSVAQATGKGPQEEIDLTDKNILLPVMKAIVLHENGIQPYDDATYEQAINQA